MISTFSPWTLYFMIISTFGITGWYSDLFKTFLPAWAAVGVFMVPIVIVVFIQWGEASPMIVARAHMTAAAIFTLLSIGMEFGRFFNYHPESELLCKVLAHLGWIFAWGAIFKKARAFRQLNHSEKHRDGRRQ
jgi:hypothetical protein